MGQGWTIPQGNMEITNFSVVFLAYFGLDMWYGQQQFKGGQPEFITKDIHCAARFFWFCLSLVGRDNHVLNALWPNGAIDLGQHWLR